MGYSGHNVRSLWFVEPSSVGKLLDTEMAGYIKTIMERSLFLI